MDGTRRHGGGDDAAGPPAATPAAATVAADAGAAAAGAAPADPPPAPSERVVLPPGVSAVACASCGGHLAKADDLLSKSYTGRLGRAYQYRNTINTTQGESEDRLLLTGLHTVAELTCVACSTAVGWTYVAAADPKNANKVGTSVLEKCRIRQ